MSRKKIIAGNWKMNKTPSEAVELVKTLAPLVQNPEVDVVYCVPAIDIVPVAEAIKGSGVKLGAENMYCEDKGAYTGEISAAMLKDAGVLRGSYSQIAKLLNMDGENADTLAKYLGLGKKQAYADWITEYTNPALSD